MKKFIALLAIALGTLATGVYGYSQISAAEESDSSRKANREEMAKEGHRDDDRYDKDYRGHDYDRDYRDDRDYRGDAGCGSPSDCCVDNCCAPCVTYCPKYYCEKRCCYVPCYYNRTCCRYVTQCCPKLCCRYVPEYYYQTSYKCCPQYYTVCECAWRKQTYNVTKCCYVPQYTYPSCCQDNCCGYGNGYGSSRWGNNVYSWGN